MAFPDAASLIVLGVAAGALVLFATELLRAELVALLVATVLMLAGVVTPEEGVSGFSNSATITVLALFILSAGVYQSGIVAHAARRLSGASGMSERRILALLILVAGPASMFLNNTAVVAILIPFVLTLAKESGRSPSRLLMPLSQIAMLAGTVTLIGTSTNVLTSSLVAAERGRGFGMFEFSSVGIVVFAVGALYVMFASRRLIPERVPAGMETEDAMLREFVTEVRLASGSPLVGQLVEAAGNDRLDVVRALRRDETLPADAPLQEGDVLVLRADRSDLAHVEREAGVEALPSVRGSDVERGRAHLVEVVIAPNSSLVRRTLNEADFARAYDVRVLGLRKSRPAFLPQLRGARLDFGDTLLLLANPESLQRLRADPDLILAEEHEHAPLQPRQALLALGIVGAVVALAATGTMPILVAGIAGALLMVVTGVLGPDDLWGSVRWDVIFLMAGIIPLGIAMENTGVSVLVGDLLAGVARGLPDLGIIALFYVASMLLTAVMSNNGNVVVLVPVAFATAASLAVDPIPLVLAVMFASSTDFLTPFGYQTNLMVYGPGGYRFTDYARVGAPLSLILVVVTSYAIGTFFPLR